jgi:hypothetical protein
MEAPPKPRDACRVEESYEEEVDHAAAFKNMVRDAGRVEESYEEEVDHAAAFKKMVRDAGRVEEHQAAKAAKEAETIAALEKERAVMAASRPRPLEAVAAATYEEAREYAAAVAAGLPRREAGSVVVAPEPTPALKKAFKHHPLSAADYSEAEWKEVPDTTEPPNNQAVFNCVKRYRFIKYGNGPLAGGPKLIIELELMSGTTLRHIIKLSQVKGVLTKGNRHGHAYVTALGMRPEKEVIIDMRRPDYGYAPEQIKFKLSGDENALAFHLALMDAL